MLTWFPSTNNTIHCIDKSFHFRSPSKNNFDENITSPLAQTALRKLQVPVKKNSLEQFLEVLDKLRAGKKEQGETITTRIDNLLADYPEVTFQGIVDRRQEERYVQLIILMTPRLSAIALLYTYSAL